MTADIVIRNTRILDGTGAGAAMGHVAVTKGRISSIGPDVPASEVIEAKGLTLAPGFIDVHTHDDVALIANPDMGVKTRQGVTTVITGLCGYSAAPFPKHKIPPEEYDILLRGAQDRFETFADYLKTVEEARPATNWLPLVGHSTLRIATMDRLDRAATQDEIERMGALLIEAVKCGAAGLSTGLAYDMASAAPTSEVTALCRYLCPSNGLHVTHLRSEAEGMIEAVQEALQIGRDAGVGTVFSHHKAIGPMMHGKTIESLAIIDQAALTQEVALDAYPYSFSSTSLTLARAQRGGRVTITRSDKRPDAVGRDLHDLATEMGCHLSQAVARLIPAGALYHAMAEEDVARVLQHPCCMIGSDGLPFDPHPHPRLIGSFPRVLGHYVREKNLISLPEAVRRMTSLSADTFGLKDRGRIKIGAIADLVLFDPETIADQATPSNPHRSPAGINLTLVGGKRAGCGTGQQLLSYRNPEK